MAFALDLQKFAEKVGERADDAVGAIVIGVAAEVDKRSPVGDPTKWSEEFKRVGKELGWFGEGYVGGRFRGNWQVGVTERPNGTLPNIDPTGVETQTRIQAAIPGDASGKVYYLVNNLPYALRLEDGYSKQAPKGMVGLTVTHFQAIVKKAVEEVRA